MAGATVADQVVLGSFNAHVHHDPDESVSISLQGWKIHSRRRPILSDQDKDNLSNRISRYWARRGKSSCVENDEKGITSGHNFTPLPEILFGQSFLELRHEASGLILRFNTTGALVSWAHRHLDPQLEIVKVPEASQWAAHLGPEATAAGLKQVRYDWVFGTDYEGEILTGDSGVTSSSSSSGGNTPSLTTMIAAEATPVDQCIGNPCDTRLDAADEGRQAGPTWESVVNDESVIDRRLLQPRDPILFYDDITLYEDELHDHGAVQLNVKIRVMPSCWFVLMRYFLRVDGMLLKIRDTRYFHRFGEMVIGKEGSSKEITFTELKGRGLAVEPSAYRDANKVAALLGPPEAHQTKLVLSRPS